MCAFAVGWNVKRLDGSDTRGSSYTSMTGPRVMWGSWGGEGSGDRAGKC